MVTWPSSGRDLIGHCREERKFDIGGVFSQEAFPEKEGQREKESGSENRETRV